MKKLYIFPLVLIMLCIMTSCGNKSDLHDMQPGVSAEINTTTEEEQSISNETHEHIWSEWEIIKTASCKQEGMQTRTCPCGEKETQKTPVLEHTYSWNIIKNATCTTSGSKEGICSCGEKETQTISATGHNWVSATCTKSEFCKNCNRPGADAFGHDYSNGVCSNCGENSINKGIVEAVNDLKSTLKSPSSLQLNEITCAYIDNYDGEDRYCICIDYSAMNGAGGMNRDSEFYYIFISNDGEIDTKEWRSDSYYSDSSHLSAALNGDSIDINEIMN